MDNTYEKAEISANFIKNCLPEELKNPKIAIICGSGLGGISNTLDKEFKTDIEYKNIPGFCIPTAKGHEGKLVAGFLGKKKIPVLCLVGRFHYYEGHNIKDIVFPVRVFAKIGIKSLIVTNAAGGINPTFSVGDIMVINDHISFPGLSGLSPLIGPNDDRFGPRFTALSDAYCLNLQSAFFNAAKSLNLGSDNKRKIHKGVYTYVAGPTYETRAEIRALRVLGGDAVGMSTVPEVIVARHSGINVLALSLITNVAVSDPPIAVSDTLSATKNSNTEKLLSEGKANHEEVLQVANLASIDLQNLIATLVDNI